MSRKSLRQRLPDSRFEATADGLDVHDADGSPPGTEPARGRRDENRHGRDSHSRAEVGWAGVIAQIAVRPGKHRSESFDPDRSLEPVCELPPDPIFALLGWPQNGQNLSPGPSAKVLDDGPEHLRRRALLPPAAAGMKDQPGTDRGSAPPRPGRHAHPRHCVPRKPPPGDRPDHFVDRMLFSMRAREREDFALWQTAETRTKPFVPEAREAQRPPIPRETGHSLFRLRVPLRKEGIDLPAVERGDRWPAGEEARHLGRRSPGPQFHRPLRREEAQGGFEADHVPERPGKEHQSRPGRSFPLHGGFVTIF